MSRMKKDVTIGYRAAECVRERYTSPLQFARESDLDRKMVYRWEVGSCPTGRALQAMCEMGFDVVYILTGRRCDDEQP